MVVEPRSCPCVFAELRLVDRNDQFVARAQDEWERDDLRRVDFDAAVAQRPVDLLERMHAVGEVASARP